MTVRTLVSKISPPPHKLTPLDTGISERTNTSGLVVKNNSTDTVNVDCDNTRNPHIGREKEPESSYDVVEVPIPGVARSLEEKTTTTLEKIETPQPSPGVREVFKNEGTSPQVNDSHTEDKKQAGKALFDSDQNVPVAVSLLSKYSPTEEFEHSTVMTGLATADSEESEVIIRGAGLNTTTGNEYNHSKLIQILPTEDSVQKGSSLQFEGTVQDDSETSSINEVKDGQDSSYRSSEDHYAVSPVALHISSPTRLIKRKREGKF